MNIQLARLAKIINQTIWVAIWMFLIHTAKNNIAELIFGAFAIFHVIQTAIIINEMENVDEKPER